MLKVSQWNDHCVWVMAAHQTEWKKAFDDTAMPSWHKAPVQWIHRRYTYYYSWNDTARVIYTASIYRYEWSTTVEYTLGTTMRSRRSQPNKGSRVRSYWFRMAVLEVWWPGGTPHAISVTAWYWLRSIETLRICLVTKFLLDICSYHDSKPAILNFKSSGLSIEIGAAK